MGTFLVGMSEVVITPPVGVELRGYDARKSGATGVHDDLKAVAVVFDDRKEKCAICSVDVCGLPAWLVKSVRLRAGGATGILPERMMIAATHTHSGPALESANVLNQRYVRDLEDLLVRVIEEADAKRRSGRFGIAVGKAEGIGGNRRNPAKGAVDRTVAVSRLEDEASGELIGVILNHACHATTLGAENLLITADYPGQARDLVQREFGAGTPVLFLNGACGDVNPGGYSAEASALGKTIPGRTFEKARAIGNILAEETIRLLKEIRTEGGLSVQGGCLAVSLPANRVKLPAEADQEAQEAERRLQAAIQKKLAEPEIDRLKLERMYARAAAGRARKVFSLPDGEMETEVQGVCVGDTIFLGLPGEVFTEIGMDIREGSPFGTTVIVGYANDSAGYFPTPEALSDGGYEVRVSLFGEFAVRKMQGMAVELAKALDRSRRNRSALPVAGPARECDPDLKVSRHLVKRAKFPAVDFHLHYWNAWRPLKQAIADMDAMNVRYGVNLVGDAFPGAALEPALAFFREDPGRFIHFSGFDFRRMDDPDWAGYVESKLDHDMKLGSRGIKLYKELGLVYRDSWGRPILPDDTRLIPIWKAAADRNLPVLYHIADPPSRFEPMEMDYQAWKNLDPAALHWQWGFPWFPSYETLLRSMENLAAANPHTTFVFPHMASMTADLKRCSAFLRKYPNVHVDTGARLSRLGRQPYTAREFFIEQQDRILWGTDQMWPNREDDYFGWFRFLETKDEFFSYTVYGRTTEWRMYGLGLPDEVLEKVYGGNAARLLGVKL